MDFVEFFTYSKGQKILLITLLFSCLIGYLIKGVEGFIYATVLHLSASLIIWAYTH
jgi:hypothetical protein